MRKALHIFLCLFCLGCLTACEGNLTMESEMLKSEQICLKVNGKLVYNYNAGTDQLAYNATKYQFRAGSDNMGDYFVVTCLERPTHKGQSLEAIFQWTENKTVVRKKRTVKVEKLSDNGYVWLWNRQDKIGAVVKVLE